MDTYYCMKGNFANVSWHFKTSRFTCPVNENDSKIDYLSLLALEDESRNKDCVHVEVAKIPVLEYVNFLYEIGRIDYDEKINTLKNYGMMDEIMQTSIDELYHPIFTCMEA